MSTTGKWREEQVLIICPGSQTTMAQLGCNELTPPAHRFPTRMFPDVDEDESDDEGAAAAGAADSKPAETTETDAAAAAAAKTTKTTKKKPTVWRPYHTYKRTKLVDGKAEDEWVEDVDSDEGAVYPLRGGRIVNMAAFLAFLGHIHSVLTTTFHNTPVMLMASPQWTRPDCEIIAQYVFERTRTPALCLIHSAIATQYGLKSPNMTVVDIGYEKVDVTAIHDGRVVNNVHVGAGNFVSALPAGSDAIATPTATSGDDDISGGQVFTRRLHALLKANGFTHDMAEQLKRSAICEVLPYAPAHKALMELPAEDTAGALESAQTEAAEAEAATAAADSAPPPNPAAADVQGQPNEGGTGAPEDEGVLDVASIVTSGQTKEFLAKKEKEKASGKKGESVATKAARLPNAKRTHNSFAYEEVVQEEVPKEAPKPAVPAPAPAAPAAATEQPAGGDEAKPATEGEQQPESSEAKPAEGEQPAAPTETAKPEEPSTAVAPPAPAAPVETELRPKRVKRDIEVGPERFAFADRAEIDRIVGAIYHAVQGIDDMYMRPACWENLVFVGNGARLRGLKDNILQTLQARHIVSPSTATMFTSELPSNVATPTGTGSQTPTSIGGPGGGPNPLLQAATTASSLGVAGAAPELAGAPAPVAVHHFHSQTPTAIKTVALPTYLQEWSKNGFEEAMFLGAQVASRIVFCLHSNMDAQSVEAQRLASLSRVDYNELGPRGIRNHSMLG